MKEEKMTKTKKNELTISFDRYFDLKESIENLLSIIDMEQVKRDGREKVFNALLELIKSNDNDRDYVADVINSGNVFSKLFKKEDKEKAIDILFNTKILNEEEQSIYMANFYMPGDKEFVKVYTECKKDPKKIAERYNLSKEQSIYFYGRALEINKFHNQYMMAKEALKEKENQKENTTEALAAAQIASEEPNKENIEKATTLVDSLPESELKNALDEQLQETTKIGFVDSETKEQVLDRFFAERNGTLNNMPPKPVEPSELAKPADLDEYFARERAQREEYLNGKKSQAKIYELPKKSSFVDEPTTEEVKEEPVLETQSIQEYKPEENMDDVKSALTNIITKAKLDEERSSKLENQVQEQKQKISELETTVHTKDEQLQEANETIISKDDDLRKKDDELESYTQTIVVKDKELEVANETIFGKNVEISKKDAEIEKHKQTIQTLDTQLKESNEKSSQKDEQLQEKDNQIATLTTRLEEYKKYYTEIKSIISLAQPQATKKEVEPDNVQEQRKII